MEGYARKVEGKEPVTLTAAQRKRYGQALVKILKLKRKIASVDPLKDQLKAESDKLKAELLETGVDELRDAKAVAIVAKPSSTEWDIESLLAKLTGDELDELCPRAPKKGKLTALKDANADFAAKVEDCFETMAGEPTLTVKAA